MNLSALIEESKGASPCVEDSSQRWRLLWPLYSSLRARGLPCKQAVQWMVQRNVMEPDDFNRALDAFHKMATRRNKKKASA